MNLVVFSVAVLSLISPSLSSVQKWESELAKQPWKIDPFGGGSSSDARDVTCGVNEINTDSVYRISSPLHNYAMVYPTGFECLWRFLGVGCYPVINCDSFQLPGSNDCSGTNLFITDELTSSKRFCGNQGPQNVSTGSHNMNAHFQKSIDIPTKGFSCIVTCLESLPATGITILENNMPKASTAKCVCGIPGSSSSSSDNSSTQATDSSGTVQTHRVVGGKNALSHYWKWQVAMIPKTRKNPFCGTFFL